MSEELRYRTEQVPLTFGQRADIWWKGIIDAIRAKPETHWTRWIVVKKGEPGYDTAPWGCSVDPNPLRYTVNNDGEWIQVEPEREKTPPNLKWFDGQP